jgi:hypothetical protein
MTAPPHHVVALSGGKGASPTMTAHAPDWLHRADLTLHSGARSAFKIECDALTDEEITTFAGLILGLVGVFGRVVGVPRGGLRIATALDPFCITQGIGRHPPLIVDDVLTTGQSMERARLQLADEIGGFSEIKGAVLEIKGAVLFARGPCPAWVTPVFTLSAPR